MFHLHLRVEEVCVELAERAEIKTVELKGDAEIVPVLPVDGGMIEVEEDADVAAVTAGGTKYSCGACKRTILWREHVRIDMLERSSHVVRWVRFWNEGRGGRKEEGGGCGGEGWCW